MALEELSMAKTRKILTRAQVSEQGYPYEWLPNSVLRPGQFFKWKAEFHIDFHQVKVDWLKPYIAYCNKVWNLNIDPSTIDFYNLQYDPNIPLTPQQHEETFVSFARLSQGGYGACPMYDGMREQIKEILDAGIKVKIVTWTPGVAEKIHGGEKSYGTGIAQRVTHELIEKLDLGIDVERDVKFMGPSDKKWYMAKNHVPLIAEDNPETAVAVGTCMGHAVLLVPASYNKGLIAPNVLPLKDRAEIAKTAIDFFQALDEADLLM
jgi:hypothetical protein